MSTLPANLSASAVLQLLEKSRLGQDELDARLAKALDPAYWRTLNPELTVGERWTADTLEEVPSDAPRPEEVLAHFAREQYFQTGPMLAPSLIGPMRRGIETLRREGWPPVFAFVYDQFWLVARGAFFRELLTRLLGSGYRQIPHAWAFYIQPRRGAAGWPPHDDGDRPDRINVWIPLTDATLDNGCLCVIPKDLEPAGEVPILKKKAYDLGDVQKLLQAGRALPARAGSYLGWDFRLIHWSSTCLRAGEPRVSLFIEFVGEGTALEADEHPLLDAQGPLPTLSQRLEIIGRGIQTYDRFDPLLIRYRDLAKRLVQHARSG